MLSIQEMTFPLLLLYAEVHYRFFPFFPSMLFKREPEVLFDVPNRINPDEDLPIFLIINDLYRFPVSPEQVSVTVTQPGTGTSLHQFTDIRQFEIAHPFEKFQRAFIFTVARRSLPTGIVFINATVTLKSTKRKFIVFNDNLNTSSKQAFRCFCADNPLPGSELCSYGDVHVHSQFSQSHVEFGPPLHVIDRFAKSCGLSFVGITDHSYDLACRKDNYLIEDTSLERWNLLRASLSGYSDFQTVLLQGEEISCRNTHGGTVHLGALGITDFIPGSRDGARKNIRFKEQLTIKQAIEKIHQQGGIAFAAHPGSECGLLQRLFLHRGIWSEQDVVEPIDALQAFNNGFGPSWKKSIALWRSMLQQGIRIPLLAGNDAHGDFSRYRAIKKPFLSIYENFHRFMGYGKTGIYGSTLTLPEILLRLKTGSSFITTGPFISINYSEHPLDFSITSTPSRSPEDILFIHAISTPEFGKLRKLTVYSGTPRKEAVERPVLIKDFSGSDYQALIPVETGSLSSEAYVRAEIVSTAGEGTGYAAYSNCCFMK